MPRATRERETAAKLTLLLGTARQRASHIESGVHTRVVNTPATPAARQLVATLRTRLMAAAVTFTPDAGVQAVHAAWAPTIANLMSRREQDGVQGLFGVDSQVRILDPTTEVKHGNARCSGRGPLLLSRERQRGSCSGHSNSSFDRQLRSTRSSSHSSCIPNPVCTTVEGDGSTIQYEGSA